MHTYLPLSPGTAAIHMILAEQTAMQASTMGSSLIFNRHTWRGPKKVDLFSLTFKKNTVVFWKFCRNKDSILFS